MALPIDALLTDLNRAAPLTAAERQDALTRAAAVVIAPDHEIVRLLEALAQQPPPAPHQEQLLEAILERLADRRRRAAPEAAQQWIAAGALDQLRALYQHLTARSPSRHQLLRCLSVGRLPAELDLLGKLLADDPPQDAAAAAVALSPLFQHTDYDPAPLFPDLLDGLAHPAIAALILDLCNFTLRKQLLSVHPAAARAPQLVQLLGATIERLGHMEEQPWDQSAAHRQISRTVADAVSLAVSLCDALALIGQRSAIGKFYQALELGHRRLRTEAAAALARLGEEEGCTALLAMADEPVARLRVLAYAEELGLGDRIAPEHKTDQARAEAELALWLAQPTQFGLPPTSCELVDQRTQFWPSYEQPMTCYLFRYTYELGGFRYSNIGIAGPLVHTFSADLGDLPPHQIYAAFAGWQAEHREMTEQDVEQLTPEQYELDVEPLVRRLAESGYEVLSSMILGSFFGQHVLVARAEQEGTGGVVVIDDDQTWWWPARSAPHPLGPQEAWCIYKGHKLLEAFNDEKGMSPI